jgi:cytochrome c oxidase cbb3-type subunit I/II
MVFPQWNIAGISLGKETLGLSFGRLRPLHTNAVIFAFVGNGIFMGVYYSLQRLLKTRMASDMLSKIHFWGWQLIIVAAAVTLPLGFTTRNTPGWDGPSISPLHLSRYSDGTCSGLS